MKMYILPLFLSVCFAAPASACDCLPFDDEPPTKYVSFTITDVGNGVFTAINKKKERISFTANEITVGNELNKGDIVLVKETNDTFSKILGVELFIPFDQAE